MTYGIMSILIVIGILFVIFKILLRAKTWISWGTVTCWVHIWRMLLATDSKHIWMFRIEPRRMRCVIGCHPSVSRSGCQVVIERTKFVAASASIRTWFVVICKIQRLLLLLVHVASVIAKVVVLIFIRLTLRNWLLTRHISSIIRHPHIAWRRILPVRNCFFTCIFQMTASIFTFFTELFGLLKLLLLFSCPIAYCLAGPCISIIR